MSQPPESSADQPPITCPRCQFSFTPSVGAPEGVKLNWQGVVHRDVKPSNLLLARDVEREMIKLADFGLAKVYLASPLSGLTLTGASGGTLPFTLDKLLTGRFVYTGLTPLDMMVQAMQTDYQIPPLRTHRPELPAQLEQVLQRALSRRPEERFPDVAAFRRALLPFAAG